MFKCEVLTTVSAAFWSVTPCRMMGTTFRKNLFLPSGGYERYYYPEDGGILFLLNVGTCPQSYVYGIIFQKILIFIRPVYKVISYCVPMLELRGVCWKFKTNTRASCILGTILDRYGSN
jgi:hypothetical protein